MATGSWREWAPAGDCELCVGRFDDKRQSSGGVASKEAVQTVPVVQTWPRTLVTVVSILGEIQVRRVTSSWIARDIQVYKCRRGYKRKTTGTCAEKPTRSAVPAACRRPCLAGWERSSASGRNQNCTNQPWYQGLCLFCLLRREVGQLRLLERLQGQILLEDTAMHRRRWADIQKRKN
jgi:hypothetical protein